jgi:hypothetical protein
MAPESLKNCAYARLLFREVMAESCMHVPICDIMDADYINDYIIYWFAQSDDGDDGTALGFEQGGGGLLEDAIGSLTCSLAVRMHVIQ